MIPASPVASGTTLPGRFCWLAICASLFSVLVAPLMANEPKEAPKPPTAKELEVLIERFSKAYVKEIAVPNASQAIEGFLEEHLNELVQLTPDQRKTLKDTNISKQLVPQWASDVSEVMAPLIERRFTKSPNKIAATLEELKESIQSPSELPKLAPLFQVLSAPEWTDLLEATLTDDQAKLLRKAERKAFIEAFVICQNQLEVSTERLQKKTSATIDVHLRSIRSLIELDPEKSRVLDRAYVAAIERSIETGKQRLLTEILDINRTHRLVRLRQGVNPKLPEHLMAHEMPNWKAATKKIVPQEVLQQIHARHTDSDARLRETYINNLIVVLDNAVALSEEQRSEVRDTLIATTPNNTFQYISRHRDINIGIGDVIYAVSHKPKKFKRVLKPWQLDILDAWKIAIAGRRTLDEQPDKKASSADSPLLPPGGAARIRKNFLVAEISHRKEIYRRYNAALMQAEMKVIQHHCELSPSQRSALRIAAKGAADRQLDKLTKIIQKSLASVAKSKPLVEIEEQLANTHISWSNTITPCTSQPIWTEAVEQILRPDQLECLAQARSDRLQFRLQMCSESCINYLEEYCQLHPNQLSALRPSIETALSNANSDLEELYGGVASPYPWFGLSYYLVALWEIPDTTIDALQLNTYQNAGFDLAKSKQRAIANQIKALRKKRLLIEKKKAKKAANTPE